MSFPQPFFWFPPLFSRRSSCKSGGKKNNHSNFCFLGREHEKTIRGYFVHKPGNKPYIGNIWVFPKIKVPQNGWFVMEIPIKMDDVWVPLFLETSIWISEIYSSPPRIGSFRIPPQKPTLRVRFTLFVWSALDLQSPETTVKLRFFPKHTKTNYVVRKVWVNSIQTITFCENIGNIFYNTFDLTDRGDLTYSRSTIHLDDYTFSYEVKWGHEIICPEVSFKSQCT